MSFEADSKVKPFLDEDFMLDSHMAKVLFHQYAKDLPIIDYHCHLPPDELANNRNFQNLTQIWLDGDHYKWRAMRTLGIDERYITGDADDFEKFEKWAYTVPYTLRNPLFHWTHLELKTYFGITDLLSPQSAHTVYHQCAEQLSTPEFSTQSLVQKMGVELICTTDDPADDLVHHRAIGNQKLSFEVRPTFRPDRALMIGSSQFPQYINNLAQTADVDIQKYDDLLQALHQRITYFHEHDCRLSDHGLEYVYAHDFTIDQARTIFLKRMRGEIITDQESDIFSSALLHQLGIWYAEKGWVMQLHLGAQRNNNSRLEQKLGPDTGFDSIGDWPQAQNLSRFLNHLDQENKLPKTIIYNLNPSFNEVIATMIGNFNDGSVKAKMQFGSAWWFLDQIDGMEKQLNTLSNMGLLSCFVGMLTDSRSFLSYPRHEYFRRILCNLMGNDVHRGLLPNDEEWLGKVIKDICYHNAKEYFDF